MDSKTTHSYFLGSTSFRIFVHLLRKLQSVALGLDQKEIHLPSVVAVIVGVIVVVGVVVVVVVVVVQSSFNLALVEMR